jgi:hypothetical protein
MVSNILFVLCCGILCDWNLFQFLNLCKFWIKFSSGVCVCVRACVHGKDIVEKKINVHNNNKYCSSLFLKDHTSFLMFYCVPCCFYLVLFCYKSVVMFFPPFGSMAQFRPWPPSMKLSISLQLLDLGQSDSLDGWWAHPKASTYTQTQKNAHTTQTLNIHALRGIRTHSPSICTNEDSSCLRLLGYCDRHCNVLASVIFLFKILEKLI